MKGSRATGIVLLVAALHLSGLSLAAGPRCLGYVVAAYLSAVVVWGSFMMSTRKRRAVFALSVIVALAVQQVAYQVWKVQLGGFWWPLAQFCAVHLLIGVGAVRPIGHALRLGMSGERQTE